MIVKDPVCGMRLDPEKANFKTEFLSKKYFFDSEYCMRSFIDGAKIAYFSMEIGVDSNIPTYSGGLGVLAGDVVRSGADLRLPLIAVTLVSKKGYLKQKITSDGKQLEYPEGWEPAQYMKLLPQTSARYHIEEITNGVHSHYWTCPCFRELFNKYIRGWANEPELLVRVDVIPDEEIWAAHQKAKQNLLDFIHEKAGVTMDADTLTIGFARRATEYKRATMIFSDLDRLREAQRDQKIQLIFAGKAHPKDVMGKKLIEEIYEYIERLKNDVKIVYLENYTMEMAGKLTSGVDVWLNTPLPPYEASGTSGMKAAHNGVINFSVLDGWWIEGCVEGLTGWAIGPSPDSVVSEEDRRRRELNDIYGKLQYLISPKYYETRDAWIDMMKNSVGKVAYYFNTHRMMRKYSSDAYL